MRILITGCCGHIGSYFIRKFRGHDIVGIDNMMTQRYASLLNLSRNVQFKEMDFSETNKLNLENFDAIIHLAGLTNAVASNVDELKKEYEQDASNTKRFIRAAQNAARLKWVKEMKPLLFFFPSSTSVYGAAKDVVTEDDESVINPQSLYANQKYELENYLKTRASWSGLKYVVARFGTIFGVSRGMRFHTAINKFCWQASLGEPLTVWRENYEQSRPYLGLEDAFRFTSGILKKSSAWNQTYNVLSENRCLEDVVKEIKAATKKEVEVEFIDTPLLNQYSYEVSNRKSFVAGHRQKCKLKTGIKQTMKALSKLQKPSKRFIK